MDLRTAEPRPFAVLLLYSSSSPSADYRPLYEETTTIILGESEEQAADRAREFALTRETEFENRYGDTITWSFDRVVDVREIVDALGDRAEIYTRHFHDHGAYQALTRTDAGGADGRA